jgi:hypothetical protein
MSVWFQPRIRHPLFPGLASVAAAEAGGSCPALFGTFEQLLRAASAGALPRRAVFVERSPAEPPLTLSQRDQLWELFGVPVLTVLLDGHRRVVGYECEAQAGVHVNTRVRADSHHRLEHAPCDCGRPGVRLVGTP